jgi:hypothetical protein
MNVHAPIVVANLDRAEIRFFGEDFASSQFGRLIIKPFALVAAEPMDPIEHVCFPVSGMISVVATMQDGDSIAASCECHRVIQDEFARL